MRRILALLSVMSGGCATTLQGGAQGTMQSEGPASQEAAFAAGAGLGDGSGALLVNARGSLGVDVRTGRELGTAVVGYEWVDFGGGHFEDARSAFHFALYGGGKFEPRGTYGLLYVEFGRSWVLARSEPLEDAHAYQLTSLSLAPMLGFTFRGKEDDPPGGGFVGLGLSLRSDSFSEWHFHL